MGLREGVGTAIMVVVLAPFIGFLVSVLAMLAGMVRPVRVELPGRYGEVAGYMYQLLDWLGGLLSDPRVLAVLLGAGLVLAALGEGRS